MWVHAARNIVLKYNETEPNIFPLLQYANNNNNNNNNLLTTIIAAKLENSIPFLIHRQWSSGQHMLYKWILFVISPCCVFPCWCYWWFFLWLILGSICFVCCMFVWFFSIPIPSSSSLLSFSSSSLLLLLLLVPSCQRLLCQWWRGHRHTWTKKIAIIITVSSHNIAY